MRIKVRLDTMRDITRFVAITSTIEGKVIVTDGNGLTVNAKSLLGMLYALEFNELWCESDHDIYTKLQDFLAND